MMEIKYAKLRAHADLCYDENSEKAVQDIRDRVCFIALNTMEKEGEAKTEVNLVNEDEAEVIVELDPRHSPGFDDVALQNVIYYLAGMPEGYAEDTVLQELQHLLHILRAYLQDSI